MDCRIFSLQHVPGSLRAREQLEALRDGEIKKYPHTHAQSLQVFLACILNSILDFSALLLISQVLN
jgi:hypothetical protein